MRCICLNESHIIILELYEKYVTHSESVVCGVQQRLLEVQDATVRAKIKHVQTSVISNLAHKTVVQAVLGEAKSRWRRSKKKNEKIFKTVSNTNLVGRVNVRVGVGEGGGGGGGGGGNKAEQTEKYRS